MGSRPVAWAAFITGAIVSIGANVLHAASGDSGNLDAGRIVAAGWAPIALLLVAEMVTRSRQNGTWWVALLRWSGTGVVAAVAAIVSYGHMRDLLLTYGETPLVAHLLPLSVDGLVLVASIALAGGDDRPNGHGDQPERDAGEVPTPTATVTAAPVHTTGAESAAEPAPALEAHRTRLADHPAEPAVKARRTPPAVGPKRRQLSPEEAAARAAELIAAADSEGRDITGSEIGTACQRSQSWGRTMLRQHRQQPDPDEVADEPALSLAPAEEAAKADQQAA